MGGQFGGWPSDVGRAEQCQPGRAMSAGPSNASRAERCRPGRADPVAENVIAAQGVGAWPVCGAHL
ncbi:hypothetical protein [Nocardia brasiliensis]|uniref:hypothetical protein n=1 Tax=Nocardia brasiliensis TaxID=37326 RepID=UPI002B4AC353|nr:hypothetical protein [Nocardia brasiliensis]